MNFNYQNARNIMVENQLRPNKIKDPKILDIFKNIPKEKFIPNEISELSYSDSDIHLGNNRGYLKNLHIAQLIKFADIQKNHKILHIGALTGYVSVLLSNLCAKVCVIESDIIHLNTLKKNIEISKVTNIAITTGSFKDGSVNETSFDRILIDNPIFDVNSNILSQLSNNLGKIIFIKRENNHFGKAIKITNNNENFSSEYLFDVFSKFKLYEEDRGFVF